MEQSAHSDCNHWCLSLYWRKKAVIRGSCSYLKCNVAHYRSVCIQCTQHNLYNCFNGKSSLNWSITFNTQCKKYFCFPFNFPHYKLQHPPWCCHCQLASRSVGFVLNRTDSFKQTNHRTQLIAILCRSEPWPLSEAGRRDSRLVQSTQEALQATLKRSY